MNSIAEIGCWAGRSTYALLKGCRGVVYAVDHFKGSDQHKEWLEKNKFDVYMEFVRSVREFNNLAIFKMPSFNASRCISEADMVFIDGGHEYDHVMNDLKVWTPKAKKLISGHDYYSPYPDEQGVRQAVDEFFDKKDLKFYERIWYKWLS